MGGPTTSGYTNRHSTLHGDGAEVVEAVGTVGKGACPFEPCADLWLGELAEAESVERGLDVACEGGAIARVERPIIDGAVLNVYALGGLEDAGYALGFGVGGPRLSLRVEGGNLDDVTDLDAVSKPHEALEGVPWGGLDGLRPEADTVDAQAGHHAGELGDHERGSGTGHFFSLAAVRLALRAS